MTENGEKHESKPENVEAKGDPDDIYATLDWETNPPINGFYEMMMDLTPERRKELRELAVKCTFFGARKIGGLMKLGEQEIFEIYQSAL